MRKLLFPLLAVFLLAAGISCKSKPETFFDNPVIHGDLPDPTILRVGEKYYICATSSEWAPHFPIYESDDLVNWTLVGHVFDTMPEWTTGSAFWAPELYYHNGTVYCYYSATDAVTGFVRLGVATAKSPTDKFTDHGIVVADGRECIDAFVFNDNGQLWISWKADGVEVTPDRIAAAKLSDDGLRVISEPITLIRDDVRIGNEGQAHFKKGDYYYLLWAARGCCGPGSDYETRVARSKNFEGPYERYEGNPILFGGKVEFQTSGHGTTVETPDGRMFFVCHAYVPALGRVPILQEMYIGDDKWPHFTTGDTARIKQPTPFKGTVQKPIADFTDNFDGEKLDPSWSWNFSYYNVDSKLENGKMRLGGSPKAGKPTGSVMAQMAQSPNYYVETKVSQAGQGFKGLTMYGEDKRLVNWGLDGGKLKLVVIDGDKTEIRKEFDFGLEDAYVRMNVRNGYTLTFFWSNDGETWTELQDAEIDGRFTELWNRVPRPGLIFNGAEGQYGEFDYFKMIQM